MGFPLKLLAAIFLLATIEGYVHAEHWEELSTVKPRQSHVVSSSMDSDYFNECLMKNVKPEMGTAAVAAVRQACLWKAIPKKCRSLSAEKEWIFITPNSEPFLASPRDRCVEECSKSSSWSKFAGECTTG